jgi:hypothetical protein
VWGWVTVVELPASPDEYDQIEYGGLPVKYAVFGITLRPNLFRYTSDGVAYLASAVFYQSHNSFRGALVMQICESRR